MLQKSQASEKKKSKEVEEYKRKARQLEVQLTKSQKDQVAGKPAPA